ncbi:hypothetical protein [Parasitella parasitica]|uniref:RING-CH-type domain-containing protein n=1 Tax=Parasitella parasitica TaxID=35722 RepID=A0A0B7MYM6_9FUNG|nr:hypothetical protein [Parasitella parasitica]
MMNSTFAFLQQEGNDLPDLSWANVAVASLFLFVNGIISLSLGLKLEKSLLTSSIRCIVQLTIMVGKDSRKYLQSEESDVGHVTLIFLSSCETVYNKSDWSFSKMFPSVLLSTAFSTIFIGILGTRYAMNQHQFWLPELFIPTIGLLLGITAGAMAVGLSTCLTKVGQQADQIETFLSFGASRWEAGRTVAIEAIRLAMLPSINSMSVIGLITIPGAMTGQILGGAPIMNAVRYQQIITFMVSATTSLGVLLVVFFCIHHLIDTKHRLRAERVHKYKANVFRDIKFLFVSAWRKLSKDDQTETPLDSQVCRICYESDEDDNPLFQPCQCHSATYPTLYAHSKCFNRWLSDHGYPQQCTKCKSVYAKAPSTIISKNRRKYVISLIMSIIVLYSIYRLISSCSTFEEIPDTKLYADFGADTYNNVPEILYAPVKCA